DTGFDLLRDTATALPGDDRDIQLTLRWAGDPREEASALIVCAALAQDFAAVVHAPAIGMQPLPAANLAARAHQALAAC
ncbi:MAG TPA: hypothetical protein VGC24_02050, partial [Burkholderiaceae bacterium]